MDTSPRSRVAALGYYYITAAKSNAKAFFAATVHGKTWLLSAFIVLVLLGLAQPTLIIFGAIDFAGALWTWKSLRRDSQA
jgi:hypothetical protein